MTAEATTTEPHRMTDEQARYEIGSTVRGAALFVDVRKSSQIIDFVERHHGPEASATLFMSFLVGVMSTIDGPTVYQIGPSGDAVLALFTGRTCASDAIDAAGRAIDFLRGDAFLSANQHYLTCTGSCGMRECPRPPAFQVGAGVDDGAVTPAHIQVCGHDSQQLVGACISFASKLSGATPPNTIAVSAGTFYRTPELAQRYEWESRQITVGNVERLVMLVGPSG